MIAKGAEYPIGVVHSVVTPNGETMHATDYAPGADVPVQKAEIHLSPEDAERFLDYYREHFVDPCVKGQFCHGLVAHTLDWDHWSTSMHGERPISPDNLQSGTPYAVVPPGLNSRGLPASATHSMFGIDKPDHNASILGQDLPLAVMKNTDTTQLYGGEIRPNYDRLNPADARKHRFDDLRYRWSKRLGLGK